MSPGLKVFFTLMRGYSARVQPLGVRTNRKGCSLRNLDCHHHLVRCPRSPSYMGEPSLSEPCISQDFRPAPLASLVKTLRTSSVCAKAFDWAAGRHFISRNLCA